MIEKPKTIGMFNGKAAVAKAFLDLLETVVVKNTNDHAKNELSGEEYKQWIENGSNSHIRIKGQGYGSKFIGFPC